MKHLRLLLVGCGVVTISIGNLSARHSTLADFKLGEVVHGTPESVENPSAFVAQRCSEAA